DARVDLSFTHETLGDLRRAGSVRPQELERDAQAEPRVARGDDDAGVAASDHSFQRVVVVEQLFGPDHWSSGWCSSSRADLAAKRKWQRRERVACDFPLRACVAHQLYVGSSRR